MKIILLLFNYSRKIFILSIVFGLLAGIASATIIACINIVLTEDVPSIPSYVFLLVAIAIVFSRFVFQRLINFLFQSSIHKMRLDISKRIINAPLHNIEKIGSSRLWSVLGGDITIITNALPGIPIIIVNVIVIAGCLVYLGWLSTTYLLLVVSFLLSGLYLSKLFSNLGFKHVKKARKRQDVLFKHLRFLTDGIKELKIYKNRKNYFLQNELAFNAEKYKEHSLKGLNYTLLGHGVGQIVFFLLIGIILFVLSSPGKENIELVSGYVITILYVLSRIEIIMTWSPIIIKANVSLSEVDEVFSSLNTSEINNKNLSLNPNMPENRFPKKNDYLHFENIIFKYHNNINKNKFNLGPINASFNYGEVVFIIGGNGSGKSTLAKVISGLYLSDQGDIYLEGKRITSADLTAYRQLFSVVFSDYHLFERLPSDDPDVRIEAEKLIRKFKLDNKVDIVDSKFSTVDLSQGQKRRLALINAFLEDRPIFLFDEWAADQDPEFREYFYKEILGKLKRSGKLVLVITHDDRYFYLADRIIKLEFGQIISEFSNKDEFAINEKLNENSVLTN